MPSEKSLGIELQSGGMGALPRCTVGQRNVIRSKVEWTNEGGMRAEESSNSSSACEGLPRRNWDPRAALSVLRAAARLDAGVPPSTLVQNPPYRYAAVHYFLTSYAATLL